MRASSRWLGLTTVVGLLLVMSPGAQAAKAPSGPQPLEVSDSTTGQWCRNLGHATPDPSDDRDVPDGGAHCDALQATVDVPSRTLHTDTAASTTTAADPTGIFTSGQGEASATAGLVFVGKLTGKPQSQVHISVPIDSIDSTSTSVGSTTAYSYLRVFAWTYNPSAPANAGSWELISQSSLPPSQSSGEQRTIELDLAGSKLKGDLRLRVSVFGVSQVGSVRCVDADDDGYCDPGTITTHDGSGKASSTTKVRVGTPTFVAS